MPLYPSVTFTSFLFFKNQPKCHRLWESSTDRQPSLPRRFTSLHVDSHSAKVFSHCLFTYLSLASELLSSRDCVIDIILCSEPSTEPGPRQMLGGCVVREWCLALACSWCGGVCETSSPHHSPHSSHTSPLLGPWTSYLACICLCTSFSLHREPYL